MKTSVLLFGLALVVPIYGKAHPQALGGLHQRFHRSLQSVPATSSSPAATVAGTPTSSTAPTVASSSSSGTSSPESSGTTASGWGSGLGLSSNCYRPNGIAMGWLPAGVNISSIQDQVDSSQVACTYGNYAQITSTTTMPDSEMDTQAMPDSLQGAVYVIALQPFIPFNQVSPSAVKASMDKLLAEGSEVIWLRLAHEMDWYSDTNPLNTDPSVKYIGSTDEFKAMWKAVANAVDRSRVKMFWTPVGPFKAGDTINTTDANWFPGGEYVDIVGLDAYGQLYDGNETTFEIRMKDFCAKYPDHPVHLGETGWLQGGTAAQKEYWLEQVTSKDALDICPNYVGECLPSPRGYMVMGDVLHATSLSIL